jgi:CDP-4-dehydro-6-deoxyglucose reductase, E3
MLRCVEGTVSPRSQQYLRDSLRAQGYFLACRCYPSEDLTVELRAETHRASVQIAALDWLRPNVVRLKLKPEPSFTYRAGQFVNLILPDGTSRSYSLVSLPNEDVLEIHIRVLPSGKVSDWLRTSARMGSALIIDGPFGDCFYVGQDQDRGLLLAGNGTGIGPLWGIVRDALRSGHVGPIRFFHGAADADGLYMDAELRELQAGHSQFHYIPVALTGNGLSGVELSGVRSGSLDQVMADVMSRESSSLSGWRAYLCGDANLVMSMRRKCFGAGMAIHDIHADEFTPSVPAS